MAEPKSKKNSGGGKETKSEGIPFADLNSYPALFPLADFPKEIALEFGILPIREEPDGGYLIAFPSNTGLELVDEVRFALQCPFRAVHADAEQIEEKLRKLYGGREIARGDLGASRGVGRLTDMGSEAASKDAVSVFRKALEAAVRSRASDIHFEPLNEKLRVRFRVDGVLRDVDTLPLALQGPVSSHIKVASGMDITEKRLPQDGRIEFRKNIDLRVSAIPTNHGESVVLRILERGIAAFQIDEVGLSPEHRKIVDQVLAVQDGFIVVTGPTGSGKTTTLYAFLRELASPALKIITVEEPVEYITEGFTQIPIDSKHGTDFASALRSILRHDPDIILIGEIRDGETARIALQSALTGHQVFSTLHTNDAPSAVGRLVNIGIEPYLLNAALSGVIAQRLVRRICPSCKTEREPTPGERTRVEKAGLPAPQTLYFGKGCPDCYGTGYRGRTAIFEIMQMVPEIQSLILSRSPAGRIREAARAAGMKDMARDGMWKACRGETTIEEVMRVVS